MSLNLRKVESWIRYYTNKSRRKNGVKPLKHDASKKADARYAARVMRKVGRCGHFAKKNDIAAVLYGVRGGDERRIARRIVNMWNASSGHNFHMHHGDYGYSGVGVCMDRRGNLYASQVLALSTKRKVLNALQYVPVVGWFVP